MSLPGQPVSVFVQARLGSSRLPGKVMADIAGRPLLEHVLTRALLVPHAREVVLLTPAGTADEPLKAVARRLGVGVSEGSEADVLDRFHGALASREPASVVRLTADNPLIDPSVIGDLLELYAHTGCDYAALAAGPDGEGRRRFPHGLDAEVISAEALRHAWRCAEEPFDREHVSSYVWRRPESFSLRWLEAPRDHAHQRWTVDEPADLERVRAIFARMGGEILTGYERVLALLDEPE